MNSSKTDLLQLLSSLYINTARLPLVILRSALLDGTLAMHGDHLIPGLIKGINIEIEDMNDLYELILHGFAVEYLLLAVLRYS